ncbi:MAG: DUF4364 family protein [Thermofilaceae archaeon]
MKRRTKLRILADILRVLESGEANITKLMMEANLSYARLMRYLDELVEKELVVREEDGREVKYRITKRGREFLREYERIMRIAEAFGVEI